MEQIKKVEVYRSPRYLNTLLPIVVIQIVAVYSVSNRYSNSAVSILFTTAIIF